MNRLLAYILEPIDIENLDRCRVMELIDHIDILINDELDYEKSINYLRIKNKLLGRLNTLNRIELFKKN